MAGMLSRAVLSQDMADIISQAHSQARLRGFSTLMIGSRFAVITPIANLEETIEGCCSELVDSLLEYQWLQRRPQARRVTG